MSSGAFLLATEQGVRGADGGLSLKGLGRAFIPEVIADQQGESSAGQEPADTPPPPPEPEIQTEFTAL